MVAQCIIYRAVRDFKAEEELYVKLVAGTSKLY